MTEDVPEDYPKAYWNARAQQYGVSAPGFGARTDYDEKHLKAFEKVIACDSLLDLGCGSGRLYPVLKPRCKQYTGIDFSEEMISLFKTHHELRPQDHVDHGDIAELPFPDNHFDAVISSVVLQHVIKNEKLLLIIAEIKRVLKIGGNVYLCEAMTQGALYCQPFPSYQRLRPRKMYNWLFYPEILLADQGAVYHTHHLLVGTHRILPNDRPARIILDLGSGRRKDYYAIGVDLRVITRHGKKQTDVAADALHLPFVDGCADEVQCSNLLEHFENPYPLLIEISRVLKSEGQVVIDVPYAGTQSAEADPTHKFVLSAADWALVFSGFFGKIQCEPIGVRFQTSPKWKEWQERLLKLGFYDFGQGGRYFCTQPLSIPEFRYIPWWLEDYVKSIAGEDLV